MEAKGQRPLLPDTPPEIGSEMREFIDSLPANSTLAGPDPSAAQLEDVRRRGVIFPILLQKVGKSRTVRDGRRRLKAARACHAEWVEDNPEKGAQESPYATVPTKEIKAGGLEPMLMTVSMNATARPNPATDAQAVARLMKDDRGASEIAQATGLSVSEVKERARFTDLSKKLWDAFIAGKIKASVARGARTLPASKQAELENILMENGKLTGRDVAEVRRVERQKATAELDPRMFAGPSDVGEKVDEAARASFGPAQNMVFELMVEACDLLVDVDIALGDGSPAFDEFRDPIVDLTRRIGSISGTKRKGY